MAPPWADLGGPSIGLQTLDRRLEPLLPIQTAVLDYLHGRLRFEAPFIRKYRAVDGSKYWVFHNPPFDVGVRGLVDDFRALELFGLLILCSATSACDQLERAAGLEEFFDKECVIVAARDQSKWKKIVNFYNRFSLQSAVDVNVNVLNHEATTHDTNHDTNHDTIHDTSNDEKTVAEFSSGNATGGGRLADFQFALHLVEADQALSDRRKQTLAHDIAVSGGLYACAGLLKPMLGTAVQDTILPQIMDVNGKGRNGRVAQRGTKAAQLGLRTASLNRSEFMIFYNREDLTIGVYVFLTQNAQDYLFANWILSRLPLERVANENAPLHSRPYKFYLTPTAPEAVAKHPLIHQTKKQQRLFLSWRTSLDRISIAFFLVLCYDGEPLLIVIQFCFDDCRNRIFFSPTTEYAASYCV